MTAGADAGVADLFRPDAGFFQDDAVGFFQVEVEFSIVIVPEDLVFSFAEAFRELLCDFRSDLIAFAADAGIPQIRSAGSLPNSFCMASTVTFPILFAVPLQPEWLSPMALRTGSRK